VLELVERGGPPWPEVAAQLRRAGYDDGAGLRALLENGIGRGDTLEVLRRADWSLDRLVASLAARGDLPFEIRDSLRALGVAPASMRRVLERHLPAEVVALVTEEGS
jgi:hypothetical protein